MKVNRKHPVLDGRLTRILKAFHLKMADIPEEVPYLVNNALDLPENLPSKKIRVIGAAACIFDRSGFSLGDILLWLQRHPDPAISFEAFRNMVFETGLSARAAWNYMSISRTIPAQNRHPKLSRPHHDAARALPKREQRKLLNDAFTHSWTPPELRMQARIRKQEIAMPANGNNVGPNRLFIRRAQARLAFERFNVRNRRIIGILEKSASTPKEEAALQRELTTLLREINDLKELLGHGPTPLK